MDNIYNQKVINATEIFDGSFLETRILYMNIFNTIPSVYFMNGINGEKAFTEFKNKFSDYIKDIHQYKWYKRKRKKFQFDKTIVILKNNCLIEFEECYCYFLHDNKNDDFVEQATDLINEFKEKIRREPLEINLIVQNRSKLSLKAMEIKRTKLDIDLFYEDDFKETDELIRKRLNKNNDKGIVLLHGLPGTGKTTYLRYLIGKIKKRVLFLSPSVAGNLMNPEFIELLIDNPDSVVIIEDAENIIMDRRFHSNSAVSNLLNISDGLLADFLNVQLVCTFNSDLNMVDSALMRKGRLIAKYEFGKLNTQKAKNLSKHLGIENEITTPMTIAEIANPGEPAYKQDRMHVIGFRREAEMMN